jgi:hypothetical protein
LQAKGYGFSKKEKVRMENNNLINDLNLDILNVFEKYQGKLPVYEIGNALIKQATSMLLFCAPNELLGIKTILASVEIGISSYEKTCS